MNRKPSAKAFLSVLLILIGSNICTYAATRYITTRDTLTTARGKVETFLRTSGVLPAIDDAPMIDPTDLAAAGKRLVGDVALAGGMYHWWNDSLPYYGIGIVLCVAGVLTWNLNSRPGGRGSSMHYSERAQK